MTSRARRRSACAVVVLAAAIVVGVSAASPVFWRVSTQAEFLRGTADNVSIDAGGRLLLGPNAERVHATGLPFLWSLVRAGEALWVGGGPPGAVYRVSPNGTATTVMDGAAGDVQALAAGADATVYAATSPGGQVVALDARGTRREVFDADEPYVWALATGPDGSLYVGTGNPGRIYRIPSGGEAAMLYDTRTAHVRSLAVDAAGRLIAGTGSPGRVLRIDATGRAFVLLDTNHDEITSIRVARDGAVFALAAGGAPAPVSAGQPTAASSAAAPVVTTSVSVTVTASAPATPAAAPSVPGTGAAAPSTALGGAVYRIAPDGIWDVVWQSTAETPYDAVIDDGGAILVGTGPNGKIFRVEGRPRATVLLTRAAAGQVTRFIEGPDGQIYFTTANPGSLHRLASNRAGSGTYVSEVHDARTVATWGTIRWRAETPGSSSVRLHTRSGNTAVPSETWSPWSASYDVPSGTAIDSPKARYLQWKAELRGTDVAPALFSVTAAYLPRNLAPDVTRITVHAPGQVSLQAFPTDPPIAGLDAERDPAAPPPAAGAAQTPTLGRRVYRKGLQSFAWEARDPNDDALRFEIRYREETATEWRVLKRDLTTRLFTWDTTSTPDGTYVVRVVASDAGANAPGQALTALRDTAPFDVDNAAPRIVVESVTPSGNQARVRLLVSDAQSTLERVEYRVDAERWQAAYPADGIADEREERFELTVPAASVDRLVLRVTDAMQNTATAAVR